MVWGPLAPRLVFVGGDGDGDGDGERDSRGWKLDLEEGI